MNVQENISVIKKNIPENVVLVAVSKTKSESDILKVYLSGQRVFGENKVQEMLTKHESLPKDIKWHMIGHLQRNKIKYMASFVSLIHGVDSFKTLKEIDKQAKKHNRIIPCLLQAKIAKEETKFGLSFNEIEQILKLEELETLKNIKISGLMGMATFTENTNQIKKEFTLLKHLFYRLKAQNNFNNVSLNVLSIGMSNDYKIAIDCGSTMIRIGSAIFGNRNY